MKENIYTLWIDGAIERGRVILFKGRGPCFVAILKKKSLSEGLAQTIERVLHMQKPDRIVVGQGPGSFLGIRASGALSQGICAGLNLPLYGLCSLYPFGPKQGDWVIVGEKTSAGYPLLCRDGGKIKPLKWSQMIPEEGRVIEARESYTKVDALGEWIETHPLSSFEPVYPPTF